MLRRVTLTELYRRAVRLKLITTVKPYKMKKEQLIKVFAGSEQTAILLKDRLEQIGVESIIKNDSSDAFFGQAPQIVDLYIGKTNIEKAQQIIQEIIKK